ncbi:MAG: hypothetical protein FWE66_05405, partial [Oscillospiraceae bacterium]|nr:hypothetical protein [Oscillospiraceae bacterium]
MKRALLSLTVILLLALLPLAPDFVSALPDYDVVNLGAADRARLLTLLNGSATDAGKKYVLQSDFTFNASELFETYFPGGGRRERSQYATFLSALDGNNKTITVNVDRGRMARPLFHNVGQPTGEALTVENLTLRYKGDVKVAAFMSGIARNAAFKNITVEVEGDVVASADYFADNANFYAHGFGFRAIDCSFENISLTVGDAYGGGIIGQTNRTIAERLESEKNDTATFAYGFFGELRNVSVDKVDIFVRLINATGDSGAVAAGFAGSVQAGKEGEVKNVTVSVKDAVLARQQADGALGAGAYGFARRFDKLSGALITVGSIAAENRNISAVTAARTEAAGFGGVAGEELAVGSNTVRVNEGIIVSSYGAVSASGGYIGALAEGLVFSTRDNIVEVIGDVRAKGGRLVPTESPLPDAVRVSGFYAGDGGLSSQNDKLYVSGALKAEAEGENGAVLSGFATKSRNIEGATILLGGISAKSEGEVSVSGFTDIIEEEARQKNNYIRIGGNVEVSANKTAVFAGYSACLLEAGMTVENSCVNITGRVQVNCEPAETLDVEELAVSAAGFIRGVSGGSLMQNTAVIAGDLEAKGRALESADVLVAAFMCEALKGDVVNNAVLFTGTANAVSNIKNSAIKSNFIALLAEAAVKGNAVFGQAGLEKAPKDFFISAVESGVSSFSVTDNVYVAMLGDERVSHPLDFTVVNGKVNVKPKELLYPLASLNTKRISPSEFVLDDSLEGALSIFGLTRRDAVIIGSSNSISINRKSLMGSSENLLPFITVYSKVGGFITIRDILGAEAIQPKTVSG